MPVCLVDNLPELLQGGRYVAGEYLGNRHILHSPESGILHHLYVRVSVRGVFSAIVILEPRDIHISRTLVNLRLLLCGKALRQKRQARYGNRQQ